MKLTLKTHPCHSYISLAMQRYTQKQRDENFKKKLTAKQKQQHHTDVSEGKKGAEEFSLWPINKNISFSGQYHIQYIFRLSFICEDLRQLDVSRAYIPLGV